MDTGIVRLKKNCGRRIPKRWGVYNQRGFTEQTSELRKLVLVFEYWSASCIWLVCRACDQHIGVCESIRPSVSHRPDQRSRINVQIIVDTFTGLFKLVHCYGKHSLFLVCYPNSVIESKLEKYICF